MDNQDQPDEQPQFDSAAVALDEAGAEMYGRQAWDDHINEGLKGIEGQPAEFLHAFKDHTDPKEAARAVHKLCSDRESIERLARSDPAEAMVALRAHMADVAELSDQDKLTMAAWSELRREQLQEKARPTRTYRSASSPSSDNMSAEQWQRARNAELARKGR